jgi:uncharacterized protein YbbC (DUF1343 family)
MILSLSIFLLRKTDFYSKFDSRFMLKRKYTASSRFMKLLSAAVILLVSSTLNKTISQIMASAEFKPVTSADVTVGAERMDQYLEALKGKKVAVVANQSSMVKHTHLVDTLLSLGIKVTEIFAPEHGFKGDEDAGANIKNGKYKSTVSIVSLYGEHNKPTLADMQDIDIVVYDLQDVGVRFFTYVSTLHYVMEACAENNKELIVLDRPNPNGYYVDGPVLEPQNKSIIGIDPIPLVYGMTPAEYARMLNGEKWLKDGKQCNLLCVPVASYSHKDLYELPVKPSPNLPNMAAIYLYPSVALFEGTVISVGRGTDIPFEAIGAPELQNAPYSFTPQSKTGATHPPYEGQKCNGYDLSDFGTILIKNYQKIYLFWLKGVYKDYPDKTKFFNSYFIQLAGTDKLQKQIESGASDEEIRKSWEPALSNFKKIRKRYLLYQDFQ